MNWSYAGSRFLRRLRKRWRCACLALVLALSLVIAVSVPVVWFTVLTAKDVKYNLRDVPQGERKIFIHPEELQELLQSKKGATVLDARTRYNPVVERMRPGYSHHIDGARRTSWKDFNERGGPGPLKPVSEIERIFRENGVSNDVPVVVYGSWKEEWGEEGRIFWQLDWLNHTQAYILYGGIFGWVQGKHQGRGRGGHGDFVARPVPERYASAEKIVSLLGGNTGTVIVDSREENEYNGATPFGSPHGGRIPGAAFYNWRLAFDSDNSGNLKPPQVLEQELIDSGISDQDIPAIVYCTKGVRAGFLYSVLQWAGHASTANYVNSWAEWSRNTSLPRELPVA